VIEFFSDLVRNAIATGQVKEIARHGFNQHRCRTHVPKSASWPSRRAGTCHNARWLARHDQLTNAGACARFDASQFALPRILAEPIRGQAWRHASFSAQALQGWFADDGSENGGETFQAVNCLACRQVHMINPKTGKVLGADEETN
jgi:hypothetical protein